MYRGYIIDNGVDYPAGNNHGSVCCINGQWYVFYHRMTNNSIMSRRACVEKIEILPDGTIPTVEMTSLGFEEVLSPYKITPAELACVLKGGCFITEKDAFARVITNVKKDNVIGYKYFDFGEDFGSKEMKLLLKIRGMGWPCRVHVFADGYTKATGMLIGTGEVGTADGIYRIPCQTMTGRHAIYFITENTTNNWTHVYYDDRVLFELESFVFMK